MICFKGGNNSSVHPRVLRQVQRLQDHRARGRDGRHRSV